jgi:predicted TIM-barrel fold metal-dependent hydrolase
LQYNARVKRRTFLSSAAAGLLAAAEQNKLPVIDSHIHLFDVSRPQGVPWPPKDSSIYKSALPDRYRRLAAPHGVVGAIEIECSPWFDDNQWVLDIAGKDSIIVGTIGDLEPESVDFSKQLERLHRNPLFRGIRYGNIWDRDLAASIAKPRFADGLKALADAGLVLDTANPDAALMRAALLVSDRVPNLTIVLDHLPELAAPGHEMELLAKRPHVYAKISGIVRREDGRVPLDLAFYRDRLDHIWETFGADRLMFGSDWPNSDQFAEFPDVFRLAHEFISAKDKPSQEKFYWETSLKAYHWVKRNSSQPSRA